MSINRLDPGRGRTSYPFIYMRKSKGMHYMKHPP